MAMPSQIYGYVNASSNIWICQCVWIFLLVQTCQFLLKSMDMSTPPPGMDMSIPSPGVDTATPPTGMDTATPPTGMDMPTPPPGIKHYMPEAQLAN